MKNKRVIIGASVLAAVALSVGTCFSAYHMKYAKASENYKKISELTYKDTVPAMEQFAGEYALEFYKTVKPDVELTVGDAIPIYNSHDLVCGYSIPYLCGNESYGYVNIDYTSENLVTDFVIDKGAKSMYDALSENLAEQEVAITVEDCEEKLYTTDSINYAVSAEDGKDEVFYYNDETYSADAFAEIAYTVDGEEDYGDTVNDGENDNGDSVNDGENDDGDSVNDGENDNGDKVNDGENDNGDEVNDGEKDDGDKVNDGENDKGDSVNDGEDDNGDSVNDGENDNGDSINDGENDNGDEVNDGENDYGDNVNDGEDDNGENYVSSEDDLTEVIDAFANWINKITGKKKEDKVYIGPYTSQKEIFQLKDNVIGKMNEPVMLDIYNPEKSLLTQKTIMTTTNKFAIQLAPLAAIIQQEDILLNNSLEDTFNALWHISELDQENLPTKTYYGDCKVKVGTLFYDCDMPYIMTEYGKKVGKDIQGKYKKNANYDYIKQCIDSQYSTVLTYQINQGKFSDAVNVVGYAESYLNNKYKYDYLIVADGINDNGVRYVAYEKKLFDYTGVELFDVK